MFSSVYSLSERFNGYQEFSDWYLKDPKDGAAPCLMVQHHRIRVNRVIFGVKGYKYLPRTTWLAKHPMGCLLTIFLKDGHGAFGWSPIHAGFRFRNLTCFVDTPVQHLYCAGIEIHCTSLPRGLTCIHRDSAGTVS